MEQTAYKITALPHKVWHFYETSDNWTGMYLVVGDKAAAVIDTGNGTGPLYALCREITDLPITVINTHGHGDHTGCNDQFEKVLIHPDDMPMLLRSFQLTPEKVEKMARWLKKHHNVILTEEQKKLPSYFMGPVREGDLVDLGGRTLEILSIPGHTPGGIAILDRENRLLFTGDSAGLYTIWGHIGTSIEEYRDSMQKLLSRRSEFDVMHPAHGEACVSPDHLVNLIACAEDILEKPGIGKTVEMFGFVSHQWDAHGASILYRESKVYKKRSRAKKA